MRLQVRKLIRVGVVGGILAATGVTSPVSGCGV
jgi:hypothetical protein